ncbi:MAG: hypothetical protein ACHRXM_04735 [Isosphaerales bacterium]
MRTQPGRSRIRGNDRAWTGPLPWLSLAICALAVGCEEEPRQVGDKPNIQAKAKVEPQSIINRRTQEVRKAATELQKGGAKVATTKITAKDYITLQGNAYVTIIGRASQLKIQHAMDLYHAENDRYPKDLDEFMTVIIKANGIALPVLPPYQEYGYDEKEHKLIILEYPARKDQPPQ